MLHGNLELATEEINHELRIKKSIGTLDAILLAIGFTTTNLQHFITPIAEGGIGISLASEGAVAASLASLGISTLIISGVVSYYVIQLVNQSVQEVQDLIDKHQELAEKEILFFARLMYLRRLIQDRSESLADLLKVHLGLNQIAVNELVATIETIYREEKAFLLLHQNATSEEKAICDYFSAHKERFLPRIEQSLSHFYIARPPVPKNWKPEFVGIFAGFVSFMGMSSGFIGTYYSVVSLAIGMASVSMAVPILGWAILAASIVFGLAVGLVVRHYTNKSMKREDVMETMRGQEKTLDENLDKVHELEMKLITKPQKPRLVRSHSWSGTLFDHHRHSSSAPEPVNLSEFKMAGH